MGSSLWRLPPSVPQVVLSTNHARAGVPDYEDALSGLVLVGVEFGAGAPLYRAPVPITFPDNTSGFNGIAVYDLKY